jgi:hypothetical protein
MTIDKVLNALKKEQIEWAVSAVRQPNSHDAFAYGRVVGVYAGLERALEIILSTLKEDE